MIDGTYAAQMPSYYLHKHHRAEVLRVCVQITTPNNMVVMGEIKTQNHDGNWRSRHLVALEPDIGKSVPPPKSVSGYDSDEAWKAGKRDWEAHYRNEDGSLNPRGGRENCGFYAMDDPNRPGNWCGERRSIKPKLGWEGQLKSDGSELRVQARDHILNMPGPVWLEYDQSCP